MRTLVLILVIVTVLAPRDAAGSVRIELAAETSVLGSNIEPFDLPVGVSGRLVAESYIRGETWFMAGVGYGALWSEEQTIAGFDPHGRDGGGSSATDPLRRWDLFMGPCWRSPEASSSLYGEFIVGVTMEGRDEFDGSLMAGFAAGYSWRVASGVDLVLSMAQRVHFATETGRASLSLALRWHPE